MGFQQKTTLLEFTPEDMNTRGPGLRPGFAKGISGTNNIITIYQGETECKSYRADIKNNSFK